MLTSINSNIIHAHAAKTLRRLLCACAMALCLPAHSQAVVTEDVTRLAEMPMSTDSIADGAPTTEMSTIASVTEGISSVDTDYLDIIASDSIPVAQPYDKFADFDQWEERDSEYSPDPTRAVWMSALFPGLGQIYNRRYWKLPLLVGGYLGLAYATSWNNTMLTDYTRAYRDIMDTDPTTKSYMDFFPPTVKEEDLDKSWLTNILQSRKNYFRRNRDLCIISMVGVYLLAMVDAYVDASLSHFDISPDLSIDLTPALIPDGRNRLPSIGLQWAFVF